MQMPYSRNIVKQKLCKREYLSTSMIPDRLFYILWIEFYFVVSGGVMKESACVNFEMCKVLFEHKHVDPLSCIT